jgi:hypothetical protein
MQGATEALLDNLRLENSAPATLAGRMPIGEARSRFDGFKAKKPDPAVHRDLEHGWMLPMLLMLDDTLWRRWSYWFDCATASTLPERPIPAIDFLSFPHAGTRRMVEASLNCIPNHGSWQTWGSWQYVDYLLDWLLFALGHRGCPDRPSEPQGCGGASDRLYQVFCADAMLLWPFDYFGDILAESRYGRGNNFYPTPHSLCECMTRMVFDAGHDSRTESVMDPCVGTGRFLLYASNYSLRLYGMDIDPVLCKATLVNGYFYAPWLVRPLAWLDRELAELSRPESAATEDTGAGAGEQPSAAGTESGTAAVCASGEAATGDGHVEATLDMAAALSDQMAEAAPPHAQGYLSGSEHDRENQFRFSPVLKRRRTGKKTDYDADERQGSLF